MEGCPLVCPGSGGDRRSCGIVWNSRGCREERDRARSRHVGTKSRDMQTNRVAVNSKSSLSGRFAICYVGRIDSASALIPRAFWDRMTQRVVYKASSRSHPAAARIIPGAAYLSIDLCNLCVLPGMLAEPMIDVRNALARLLLISTLITCSIQLIARIQIWHLSGGHRKRELSRITRVTRVPVNVTHLPKFSVIVFHTHGKETAFSLTAPSPSVATLSIFPVFRIKAEMLLPTVMSFPSRAKVRN